MNKYRSLCVLTVLVCNFIVAADNADVPPPLKLTAQEDHRKMMELLGIKELRRGARSHG